MPRRARSKKPFIITAAVLVLAVGGFFAWKLLSTSSAEKAASQLHFDASVTEAERQQITQAVTSQDLSYDGDITVSVKNTTEPDGPVLEAYLPVTGFHDPRQSISSTEYADAIANLPDIATISAGITPDDEAVLFIPASELTHSVKLLQLDDHYFLDDYNRGAVFRQVSFSGSRASGLASIKLGEHLPTKDSTLKINQTGVTALTRLMMRKLSSVGDATFFSEKIGDFLADADITHVSNEVSFQEGCQYSNTSFCSPPEFIETLKDSGVDLVEITGNHNNDRGNQYNTRTIELYRSLGWNVFGGGLNREDAAKPYIADIKGSKVAFIGYNMADGLGSGAIAGETTAGANYYTEEKARADITAAKQHAQFVIVNIQYAECQAYPAGYVEFPECDGPIFGQQEDFRKLIDLGADLVMGSSAHQPQTFELYNGKPIYYGLGNLYFEQTQWPGTERGIVLSHYFAHGKLLQTKLTPTVYDRDYQPRVMTPEETDYLLRRLDNAR